MKFKKYIHLGLVAAGALALMTNCDRPEYAEPTPATDPSTASSRVLFVNAAPGAPALNLLVNNVQVAQAVPFPGYQPGYAQVGVGAVQLRGKAANGTIGGTLGTNDLLFRAGATNNNNFTFVGGRNYTVFTTDTLARPRPTTPAGVTDPGGVRFLVVEDNLSAPAAGKAKVRFLHLAPNAPSVGVYNSLTNQVLFTNRAFRATSTGTGATAVNFANFTEVDAGTYSLDVRTAATSAPVLVVPSIAFEAGKIYTVYAHGLLGGTGPQALGAGVVQHN